MTQSIDLSPTEVSRDELAALAEVAGGLSIENRPRASLLNANGTVVPLPGPIFELLASVVDLLSAGTGVSVVPVTSELTTTQVAKLLNVSRPHVVSLLENGKIPFHRVGTHRRVLAVDAVAYRELQRRAAEKALAEFHRIGVELNLPD
jgi:excisionase family DNA binding protein